MKKSHLLAIMIALFCGVLLIEIFLKNILGT
ncbi:hypothetical protein Sulba_0873 [Sulfurospirillum barnesii SES-3]|uniref:Uncharacterized protein n=1 Tax=Sulfurospirillum barnesii (strain ATCC 700032 / DSM 10660 / SES-3) TaxID=760154 RepID=I3XW50_SULBS|nr:hypothetical protein Sulba_0873 [Sulfurospirillum barnesii SES-3]